MIKYWSEKKPLEPLKESLVQIQNSTLHSNVLLGFPHMIEVREMMTYLPACRLLSGLAAAEGSPAWQRAALAAAAGRRIWRTKANYPFIIHGTAPAIIFSEFSLYIWWSPHILSVLCYHDQCLHLKTFRQQIQSCLCKYNIHTDI